ncbi:alpha-L-rhamnosidase N-terminal domain-containing protein [Lentisphaera profundi]|uniref:Alpha-L-rhamnosidase N-terminal domain-containing protein n=1 Tax=Lentisphaera profundi TaxID=1658616 RepID=A0ABY7VWX1_9BACT|nr:alpha-L-rhamnosidase N-terminal domain-containing protein [Lentisphaera profundi]WDE97690.1 alpha-L-rhamnosidase N-terminal domain-containing protein [Lentisphaera profundi]
MENSKWIWCAHKDVHQYNQTVHFKKEFELSDCSEAQLLITADSWYRVSINGEWVHDGPARSYPEEMQYDVHDIAPLLQKGPNTIEVIVRYFGIGTFHQIPQQAGLRAEIHCDNSIIATDSTWLASPAKAWQQWTPKISIQMEAVEAYDARLDSHFDWHAAVELERQVKLTERKTGLMTKVERVPQEIANPVIVKKSPARYCVPITQIAHGELIEANFYTSRPVLLGAVLKVRTKQEFNFDSDEWKIAIDGKLVDSASISLDAGPHTLIFFCNSFYGHNKDIGFPWLEMTDSSWDEWHLAVAEKFLFCDNDRRWFSFENKAAKEMEQGWQKFINDFAQLWSKAEQAFPPLSKKLKLPTEQIFMPDAAAEFFHREEISKLDPKLNKKIITPSKDGTIELCYDFGEQTCGYFEFSIEAEAGLIIDLNAVEYRTPEGIIQHTLPFNRNGMRYITKKGINNFRSLKRRAGQYLFMTLRNQTTELVIHSLKIIESTAPVESVQDFKSSDPALDKIWKMSERTLQLCMEDTFTDCPLYEQTLWIGDARNEALYAFSAYGNYDVSARSLELGAQSLQQFPMVGCQVPSSWDCLLPAWSFLWGMHVWEHYFYSGDKALLEKLWPAVKLNLAGAEQHKDIHGLFSGPFWNLLEWAPIDHDNETVLHNSMMLVAALKAAENCAEVLNEHEAKSQYSARRIELTKVINSFWNESKNSYPDALLDSTGLASEKTCQHTSMLSIMCGIASTDIWDKAVNNLLHAPAEMTGIGSPFAMQFMYEALEQAGEQQVLIDSIRTKFQPMIDAGSSTVWEMFAGSDFDTRGFPTRSHCHAWASSPVYFLNRIVLGLIQIAPGGTAFEISPRLCGLTHASGATATPQGDLKVHWKRKGVDLIIEVESPDKFDITFQSNESLKGLDVSFNIFNSN